MEGTTMSGMVLPILFAAAGVLFFLLVASGASRVGHGRLKLWGEVTRRLGGKLLVKGGDLRIRFRWNGLDALLIERPRLELSIPGGGVDRFPVTFREEEFTQAPEGFTLHEMQVPGYVVYVESASAAGEFLSVPVRRVLEDLRLPQNNTPCTPGIVLLKDISVSHPGAGLSADELVRFVRLGLQLAQHVRLFSQGVSGVTFLPGGPRPERVECQICGASLEGVLVRCSRCATLHHRDCWEYAGACSTYGCGERRAVGA